MPHLERPPSATVVPRVIVALGVANLLLTLLILLIRLWSVVTRGDWVETTGFESTGLNVIAYTRHHWPPYRDLATQATTAIFNFGFYAVYAAIARAAAPFDVSILLVLRLVTLGAVIGGGALFVAWIRRQMPPTLGESLRWLAAVSIGASALLGPFIGWWPLSVRPDAAAILFETLGLVAAMAAARGRRRSSAVAATMLLAAAVAFKQTEMSVLLTVVVAWLLSGRRKDAAIGTIALALVAAAGFWLGGSHYTANIVRAAAAARYSFANGFVEAARAGVTGFAVFAPALLIAIRGTSRRDRIFPVHLVFVTCGAIGLAALTREGASRNYLFPSYMAGVILIVNYLSDPKAWTARAIRVGAAVLVCSAGLQGAYLVLPNTFGRITFPEVDVEAGRERRLAIRRAAEPVLVENGLDAVPWHSGHEDTESIDWIIYDTAVHQGTIVRSVESRIAAREYASAFSARNFRSALVSAGYRPVATFPDGTIQFERPESR